jgi:hypothetical protein
MFTLEGDNYEVANNRSDQIMIRKLDDKAEWFIIGRETLHTLILNAIQEGHLQRVWTSDDGKFSEWRGGNK